MKAPKALPTGILLAVFFVACLVDYYWYTPGDAGWLSYATGIPALIVFVWAVWGAFTNEAKGRV